MVQMEFVQRELVHYFWCVFTYLTPEIILVQIYIFIYNPIRGFNFKS